ncbi:hypothetical protein J2T20_003766 [Paenibacillus wynnii]|nr:hypothetical protein [Paenibacillus wynnii]
MMAAVEKALGKPDNFIGLARELLLNPPYERCMELAQLILGFRDLEIRLSKLSVYSF